ncbi:hypothetical protein [Kiloniella majae]|nr:hypothetical protein [Kiloniella majae]
MPDQIKKIKSGENNTLNIQNCTTPDTVIRKPEQDAFPDGPKFGDPEL